MLRDSLMGSSQTMTNRAALIDFDASLPSVIGSKDPNALKIRNSSGGCCQEVWESEWTTSETFEMLNVSERDDSPASSFEAGAASNVGSGGSAPRERATASSSGAVAGTTQPAGGATR